MICRTELKNGISLEYLDQGEGEVVLLLHGLGSTKADWDMQLDALSKHFRLIAPDMRGHGNSSIPEHSEEYGVEQSAHDMKLLMDELKIEKCHLIGFSMGGALAFELAVKHPGLVDKLVIVNTAPNFNNLGEFGEQMIAERTSSLKTYGMKPLAEQVAGNMFPEESQKHLKEAFFERASKNPVDAYYNSFVTLMQWGIGDRISEIDKPALVIASDMDYTPVELKQAYVDKMPNARLEVIKDSRHGVTMDQPEQFNSAILKFLKG
ncbi:alpha/beta hydrolase [Gramella sp. GC03-9]|uniref:Alpha/beta hydrolase n=1 Tax=Christiangramia oceanisediminis TaxID=2920386 RepID=A0A9X2I736_9FLAO|nr:alpha/beta hydrolase [Gramella oceanisediminis]MCP9198711.1 alpha/beta hydrolase [Gramella oceanisediminis]